MSKAVDDNILKSAIRFQKHLPSIKAKDEFFEGDWQSAEALHVLMRRADNKLALLKIIDRPEAENGQVLRDELHSLIKDAQQALDTQDRMCGIDSRQILRSKHSRTWSLRSWNVSDISDLQFAVRKGYRKDDRSWADDAEFERRRRSLDEDYEMAGWAMQLYFEDSNNVDKRLLAVAYCKFPLLIQTLAVLCVINEMRSPSLMVESVATTCSR